MSSCARLWICRNYQVSRNNNLDKLVQFSLVFTLAQIWEIELGDCDNTQSCPLEF